MDLAGLDQLWAVASSAKRDRPEPPRPQIGKFGIGKLATYILANEVTYVCRAADGVTRLVTMNYRRIDEAGPSDDDERLQIGPVALTVRRLGDEEVAGLLPTLPGGVELKARIDAGVPAAEGDEDYEDGFGGPPTGRPPARPGTWTIALLTALKGEGRRLQRGHIRRMLRAALPLGASISIGLNGELLESNKIDAPTMHVWELGGSIALPPLSVGEDSVEVVAHSEPFPHITVDGIAGKITGMVRLYEDRITGGRSRERGRSNGFFVNVLGRTISLDDPYFGLQNLNHGAWAHFRATVQADGLDSLLSVERDTLRRGRELETFQALLRNLFNEARNAYVARLGQDWPTAGDLLAHKWDAIPLNYLRSMISERLGSTIGLPAFVDGSGVEEASTARDDWLRSVESAPSSIIQEVAAVDLGASAPLSVFQLADRRLALNADHPFAREHASTTEESALLRELALVDLLVDARMIDDGFDPGSLAEIRRYKDELLRVMAALSRKTGAQIAELLIEATGHSRGLEVAVEEALDYLGFTVKPIGGSGEPEGVAYAPITPVGEDETGSYSLTYEAKSTTKRSGRVSNDDVNAGKLERHREKHAADHTLLIAPDFELGALQIECSKYGVTPMRAEDLALLLLRSVRRGMIPLDRIREIFGLHDPNDVHDWVEGLDHEPGTSAGLELPEFLDALEDIGFDGPDVITASVVADRIRQRRGSDHPSAPEVRSVASGLSVVLPAIIRTNGDDIFLSASPEIVRTRLQEMLERLPERFRFSVDDSEA